MEILRSIYAIPKPIEPSRNIIDVPGVAENVVTDVENIGLIVWYSPEHSNAVAGMNCSRFVILPYP